MSAPNLKEMVARDFVFSDEAAVPTVEEERLHRLFWVGPVSVLVADVVEMGHTWTSTPQATDGCAYLIATFESPVVHKRTLICGPR